MKHQSILLQFLVFSMMFSFYNLSSQIDIVAFVDKYIQIRDDYESISFNVDFENKLYGYDDTTRQTAFVELVRRSADSIYSGYVFIQTDSVVYAYDGVKFYNGDFNSSTITVAELAMHPGKNFKYDWADNYVESAFLTRNPAAKAAIQNPEIKTTIVDTIIGKWPCKGIRMLPPNQGEITNISVFIAIDTIEYMLRKKVTSMFFQENEQFQSWTYRNSAYAMKKKLNNLTKEFITSFEIQKEYVNDESVTELENSVIDYSALEGTLMNTKEMVSLNDIKTNVVILDFWYSACYPCIKSIPEVNKLYDLFHDKGVAIYGVNIIDDEVANKSRMEKYVRNNPMSYPTIMAEGELYSHWVPDGYPSLIILDSNFKLISRHFGYSEDMAEDLAHIIEEHLNK